MKGVLEGVSCVQCGVDNAPLVAIVLVNWNSIAETLRCVGAIDQLQHKNVVVIVVDNASDHFPSDKIESRHRVHVIKSKVNMGWAGGCNVGARKAIEIGCEFIWFLNNDSEPEVDALCELLRSYALGGGLVGAVGSIENDGSDVGEFQVCEYDKENQFLGPSLPISKLTQGAYGFVSCAYVSGCSMLVRSNVWEKVGEFDEDLFLYCEDVDWGLRCTRLGFLVGYRTESIVRHKGGASTGGAKRPLQAYFASRNHLAICFKHGNFNIRARALKYNYWMACSASKEDGYSLLLLGVISSLRVRAIAIGAVDFFMNRRGDCRPYIRKIHARTQ